jgi:hypothetical protein
MIQIDELIKNAMHEKNIELLGVLKLIKAEFLKKSTEPNRTSKELTEEEQMKVLMKMAAAHKDSIEQYDKAGRSDLSENEKKELDVINSFLPKEATDEEVAEYTSLAVTIYKATKDDGYVLSMKDMKGIMALVKEKYPTANGGIVSKTLKEILGVK